MKKSCLYLGLFNNLNHYDCLGLSFQIHKDLLCIFNNETYYYKYHEQILKNNNQTKVINNDPIISDILEEIKNKYSNIIFLHDTKLILDCFNIDSLIAKVTNSGCIINHVVDDEERFAMTVFSTSNLVDLARNKITLYSFLLSPNNILNKNSNIIKLSNYYQYSLTETKELKKDNKIYYEDNNCLFAIFEKKDKTPLLRSPCYINKHNQKIYSTTNSCAGSIVSSSKEKYKIKWLYNNMSYDCEYFYDKESGQFI